MKVLKIRRSVDGMMMICAIIATLSTARALTVSSHRSSWTTRRALAAVPGTWSPGSWRNFKCEQLPEYPSLAETEKAEAELRRCAPLVFAGEIRSLQQSLAKASAGNGFLLMGGDCAESFSEFSTDHIRDSMRVILQMALTITFGAGMPVIKVGRMAGQFAKPRSSPMETMVVNGEKVTLPSYKGEIDFFLPAP